MMQVLVTGGEGQLGKCIKDRVFFHPQLNCHFFDLPELDIRNAEDLAFVIKELAIGAVINAAAYTAVDQAEISMEDAFSVNSTAVSALAGACRAAGIPLIHISTDYVFDGQSMLPYREDHPVNPQSVYGRSKLEGERAFMESGAGGLIVRTSWLYSEHGKNFVKTILRLSKEKAQIQVVRDQTGSPTYAGHLAEALLALLSATPDMTDVEILHYCNQGVTNWYEFASAIVKWSGRNCEVVPVTSAEYPTLAARPAYSVLDCSRAQEKYRLQIPRWQEGLKECLLKLSEV